MNILEVRLNGMFILHTFWSNRVIRHFARSYALNIFNIGNETWRANLAYFGNLFDNISIDINSHDKNSHKNW